MSDRIDIDYLARVEGEGGLSVDISGSEVRRVILDVWEPPRFFEGFLVGRKFDEVPDMVSRICGICPVSHMTTTILALERAMGIEVTSQTVALRRLLTVSQMAASHLVHLYALALPDYVGCDSLMSMLPDYKGEFERFLKMKDVLNRLTGLIGGRALHPVTHVVKGFTKVPELYDLKRIAGELAGIRESATHVAELFSSFDYPVFDSLAPPASLKSMGPYFSQDDPILAQGDSIPLSEYHASFSEEHAPPSNAKRSTFRGEPFRVGALARINNCFEFLSERARQVAESIGFTVPDVNPFHNNIAQALEIVEAVEECIQTIDGLSELREEDRAFRICGGAGRAVTEAPRGLLFYEYEVNDRGAIEKANIVTPTSHQVYAMEQDAMRLAQSMIDLPAQDIEKALKQLVRAYDPCFSCSVHLIRV
jgi:coenzyme F420-reducing hydrogenase alpha subunit